MSLSVASVGIFTSDSLQIGPNVTNQEKPMQGSRGEKEPTPSVEK